MVIVLVFKVSPIFSKTDAKSTECPICPILLQRLSFLSGNPIWNHELEQEIHSERLLDPFTWGSTSLPSEEFQNAARLVLFTDATYIVLCPGDPEKLRGIARSAGTMWKNVPFVADNRELTICMSLLTNEDMRLDRGQAIPAILEYDGTNHIIDFGRG